MSFSHLLLYAFNHFIHVGCASSAIFWVIFQLRRSAYSSKEHLELEALLCIGK
jgi:hypothetical protein